jgi:hypothetical protein
MPTLYEQYRPRQHVFIINEAHAMRSPVIRRLNTTRAILQTIESGDMLD